MQLLTSILPAASVALLVLIALLPWGTSQSMHFFLPLLPLIGIHYWVVRRPRLMPALFVFACGLAIDALTSGPLGIWSLAYLTGFGLASQSTDYAVSQFETGRWIAFAICMVLTVSLLWAVSSLYFASAFNWHPLAVAVMIAIFIYPVIALLFWPLNKIGAARAIGSLTRGK